MSFQLALVKAQRKDALGLLCSQLTVSTAFLSDCPASYDVAAMWLDASRVFSFLLEVCMNGGIFFSNILDDGCLFGLCFK